MGTGSAQGVEQVHDHVRLLTGEQLLIHELSLGITAPALHRSVSPVERTAAQQLAVDNTAGGARAGLVACAR